MPMNCSAALFKHVSYQELREHKTGRGDTYFISITMMTMTVWFGLSASGIW